MNTIVLEGGLGNRMRVAAAAYTMTQLTGVSCRVLWTRQWGMHCRFEDLFQPFYNGEKIDSRESLFSEKLFSSVSCRASRLHILPSKALSL